MRLAQDKVEMAYWAGLAEGKELIQGTATVNDGVQFNHDGALALADVIGCELGDLISEVTAFHRERLDSEPSLTAYPELRGYRDRLLEKHRGMRDAGLSEETIALAESLGFWRSTRLYERTGIAYYAQPLPSHCRVLYMADSDRGALHLKNIDDSLHYWKPLPPVGQDAEWPFRHPLVFDGVSSGLHMDEVPPEIFPVDVRDLCREHCSTVDEARDFMVHYNYFWRDQNLLIHDHFGNSVVLEKTACRVAARGPNSEGINYANEMGALDPEISAFQRGQREKWLGQIGHSWENSPDGCAFTVFEGQWRNITSYVDQLSAEPTWQNAKELMEQREESGPMCLTGEKSHPDQVIAGCTLWMEIYEMDNRRLHRRQWRGQTPAYLDAPEIVDFTAG